MTDSLSSVNGFDKVGYIYSLEPKDVLLNKGAFVEIQYPETESNPTKLGVYYKEKDNNWVFIDNQHDPLNRTISAKVLSFEDFALIKDEIPPEISDISPADQTRLQNKLPLISINVLDKHSGINSENEIEIRLDGKRLIAEYDPERERLFYQVKEALVSGKHEILAMALDKCKNVTLKKSYFWIE